MYAEPLQLTASAVDYDFVRTRIDGNASFWVWDGSTSAASLKLRILHADGAKSQAEPHIRAMRHVFTISREEYNSSTPRKDALTLTVTLTRPGTSVITDAEELAVIDMMRDFFSDSTNIARFRRKEV